MITLSIEFDISNKTINTRFYPSVGKITRNYNYDNYPKFINGYFPIIEEIYSLVTKNTIDIKDSHKFIEALMVIYNNRFTEHLLSRKIPAVYRSQKLSDKSSSLKNDLGRFLNIIYSKSAEYTLTNNYHNSLNIHNYTHSTSPIRRIVDLINQELFYNGHSELLVKFNLEDINRNQKILKKFYRKINKLKLAKILYDNDFREMECYVFGFNDGKLDIYFPLYNLNIRQRLVNRKLESYYDVEYVEGTCVKVKRKSDGGGETIFPINKKLVINMTGKPNMFNIEGCLKIMLV